MSEVKRPTLPKEVAEAIEKLRRLGRDNRFIALAANGDTTGENSRTLYTFVLNDPKNFDVILSALVNGYETERTPEEKVREYYEDMEYASGDHYADIIKNTLDLLGIKIEGVNA